MQHVREYSLSLDLRSKFHGNVYGNDVSRHSKNDSLPCKIRSVSDVVVVDDDDDEIDLDDVVNDDDYGKSCGDCDDDGGSGGGGRMQ